jgi:CHAT domain-containing protein
VREATTVRTVASSAGFATDEIAIAAAELSSWVQQASHFAASPSASEAADWSGAARTLAELLLPVTVSNARLLLTTANGCLARLQFETLNRSDSDYVPLIQQMDVATLRFWNPEPLTRGDSCLVVVEPTFAASLRRRHADLEEPIPLSRAEADHARRQLSGSILLTGSSATKQQVVPRWERARVLYFAGHMLQDPELRYLTFIPMGQPPVGQEDDSYLEVADVRNADLSHCELVVLSSCASGAPYASGDVVAPSMAEVFLDAGARAAVSTAWPVRDEAAARLMTQFIQYYAQSGEADPIRSLCDAQRTLAVETRDPSIWANYSIHVTRLEPLTESFGHANAGERRAR